MLSDTPYASLNDTTMSWEAASDFGSWSNFKVRVVLDNMEYLIPPTRPPLLSLRFNIFSEKLGYVLSVSCLSKNKLQTSIALHSPWICQEAVSIARHKVFECVTPGLSL